MAQVNLIALLPEMIYFMEEPVDPFAFGVYSAAELDLSQARESSVGWRWRR